MLDLNPTPADITAAGRPYPKNLSIVSDGVPRSNTAAVDVARDFLIALRTWWLDAADAHLETARVAHEVADDAEGDEALADSVRCLNASRALGAVQAAL